MGSLALAGAAGPIDDYAYPIVWWGVLLLADEWNTRRHGLSLWRTEPRRFLLVTVPVSVLVWLFFEALNLAAPQWRYHSRVREVWKLVPLGFASFATVVPIIVEAWWLVGGGRRVPQWPARWLAQHKTASIAAAVVLAVLPLTNRVFWFNQGMWIVPLLALAPVTPAAQWWAGARAWWTTAAAGLLAGLAWEAFNYPSLTGWHYLILPNAPHLFQMPLPGYLGFIPFALAILVVYQWQQQLAPRLLRAAILYSLGLAGVYTLRVVYAQRGLWLFN